MLSFEQKDYTMRDQPLTLEKSNMPSDEQGRLTKASYEIGGTLGVAKTLLGGTIGTLAGKLSKRFSPSVGFIWGAIISGTITSAIHLTHFFRNAKKQALSQNIDPAVTEPKMDVLDNAAYESLKAKLACDPRAHTDAVIKPSEKNFVIRG